MYSMHVWYRNSANDLRIIIGSMYGVVLFVGINNCATVQPVITIERNVFYREKAAGMYSALPYAIAQVKIDRNDLEFKSPSFSCT